jgi:phospholipid/cholesterol/gamma-HCH transport system substrate-binding protein
MTSNKKNILVGVTVLGAFVVLGWMIIQFGGRLGKLSGGATYLVNMTAPRANGLSEGAPVQYLGSPVGRVERILLNESRNGFDIELHINQDTDLPANVTATIRSINRISGASAVVLEPLEGLPQGSLREEARIRIIQAEVAGSDLVPDEVTALAVELRAAVEEFRASGLVDNLNRQVEQVGELANAMNELVGDEELRGDVKASVASVREAAASAERIAKELEEFTARLETMQQDASDLLAEAREVSSTVKRTTEHADEAIVSAQGQIESAGRNVDEVSRELLDRLEQMDGVLADVQAITTAIEEGKGTAGKMVNDDRLYEGLVINMQLLEGILKTSNRLLEQWEQEGIRLRLFR